MDKTQKVISFLLLFAFLSYLLVLIFMVANNQVQVKPDSLLILDFHGNLVEQQQIPSLTELIQQDPSKTSTSLKDIIHSIHLASSDANIKAIYLDTEHMGHASLSKMQEIKTELQHFK